MPGLFVLKITVFIDDTGRPAFNWSVINRQLLHSRAEQTLTQLGMPPELPVSEGLGCRIVRGNDHGREGYLDGDFFKLKLLDLGRQSEQMVNTTRLALAARAIGACERNFNNVHLDVVMREHLGRYGLRAEAIMMRLVGQSVVGNGASQIATKLHIDADAAQTTIGVWDNGSPYESDRALRNAYLSDAIFDLRDGVKNEGSGRGGIEPWPTYAVWHATMLFNASMTIASGPHALDIQRHPSDEIIEFTSRSIPPIEGNGTVVRFPHITSA